MLKLLKYFFLALSVVLFLWIVLGSYEDELLKIINCPLPDVLMYQYEIEDYLNQCGTLAQLYFKSQQGIVLVPFLLLPLTLIMWTFLMFLSLPSKIALTPGKPAGQRNVIAVALIVFAVGFAIYYVISIVFGIGNFILSLPKQF